MSDLISRQEAIDIVKSRKTAEQCEKGVVRNWAVDLCVDALEKLPSIQPERPTGEWIQKPRYEDDEYPDAQPNLKCPFCGYEIGWCDMGNYCARCGADLKGKTNE